MISSASPAECFVYITLPGQTEPITAGRFVLTQDRHGDAIGRFVYGRSYRERPDAVEFDPAELRLAPRTYETTAMGGVFGALRDAGPDYWGRRVIERHAGRAQLSELDYLLHSPDDRAGALGATLVGVNNRDLRDFSLDLNTTFRLQKMIPKDIPLVSESGIRDHQDMVRLAEHGIRAALVGETLMRAADPAEALRTLVGGQQG